GVLDQQVEHPDGEVAELGQRAEHLTGDQVDDAWPRLQADLPLQPHPRRQRTTRNQRWVPTGSTSTPIRSSSISVPPGCSKRRTPSPSRIGATRTRISSRLPSSRQPRATSAPSTLTYFFPPAPF